MRACWVAVTAIWAGSYCLRAVVHRAAQRWRCLPNPRLDGNHVSGGQVHPRQHLALLLSMAAFGSTGAWASDIQCATTRQPAERVISDHAILNNEYDDIVAQQQALLSAGKLSPEQLAQWKQLRNACTDVHCIDTVFAQWKSVAKSSAAISSESPAAAAAPAAAPVMASATDMAPVGPVSDAVPVPASPAAPTSEASLVRQGSAAGVAVPQPVATEASAPAVASTAVSGAAGSHSTSALSAVALFAIALLAIGFIALIARRKMSSRRSGKPPGNVRGNDKP